MDVVKFALFGLAVALLSYQLLSTLAPITREQHSWRQSDVYSVAYSFHEERFDPLHPRIDFWRGPTGIVAMEAPIYPALVALAMNVVGEHPRAGRLVTMALYLIGLVIFAAALRPKGVEPETWTLAALVLGATSPMALSEFRTIQSDGLSVSLTMLAAASLHRASRRAVPAGFALGIALFTLAVLAKTPAVLAGPALYLLSWPAGRARLWPLAWRAAAFAVPLLALLAWTRWSQHLTATYEVLPAYFHLDFTEAEVRRNIEALKSWVDAAKFLTASYAINWALAPALLMGLVLAFARGERRVATAMALWLGAMAFFCVCFADRAAMHPYYALVLFPPALFFAARGLANLVEPRETALGRACALAVLSCLPLAPFVGRAWPTGLEAPGAVGPGYDFTWFNPSGTRAALLAIAIGLVVGLFVRRWRPALRALTLVALALGLGRGSFDAIQAFDSRTQRDEWFSRGARDRAVRDAVAAVTTRADLVVVDGYSPWFLHLVRRRGFAIDAGTDVETLVCRSDVGVRYYVRFASNNPHQGLLSRSQVIASGDGFTLHRLEPPLSGRCLFKSGDLARLPVERGPLPADRFSGERMIVGANAQLCMSASSSVGAQLRRAGCDSGAPEQRFRVEAKGDGVVVYREDAALGRLCVGPPSGALQVQLPLRLEPCDGSSRQRMTLKKALADTYFFEVGGSGWVWDLPPVSAYALQQFAFHGGSAQQWRMRAP